MTVPLSANSADEAEEQPQCKSRGEGFCAPSSRLEFGGESRSNAQKSGGFKGCWRCIAERGNSDESNAWRTLNAALPEVECFDERGW